jgi:sugar lactone lactonase YvrE
MIRLLATFILLVVTMTLGISQTNLQTYMASAREAYKAKDNKKFYELILEAHKIHPYHQGILYQAGLAAALNDQPKEAIGYLRKAIHINAQYDLHVADLSSLQTFSEFQDLKKLQAELQQPIIHADTAFVIHQKDLHIESISAGEKKGVFYLGSIHKRKILRADEKGNVMDFTSSAQDGLTSVFGVRVDLKNNILWACASPMPEMENFDTTAWSGLFKYDLKSKKLIARYTTAIKQDNAFGDLVLDSKGNPFVSDSKTSTIFTIDQRSGKLIPFYKSEEFWSIQGITFSADEKYLFVADYVKGIFRLKLDDKSLMLLPAKFEMSLKSIDGMTFYKNSLIAIQNLVTPMRSTVYRLNENQDELVSYKIIDRAHPAFNEPTIGCIVNDNFYYVANSLWSGYTNDRKIKSESELQDVVILKTDLTKIK